MKLEEIKQIRQTKEEEEVNKLLAQGYVITKIFSGRIKTENYEEVRPVYVLAKS